MASLVVRVAFCLAVVLGAVVWPSLPNLGDSPSEACLVRGSPEQWRDDLRGAETWGVEQTRSWLPLGVRCAWTNQVLDESVVIGPGTGPTVVALGGTTMALVVVTAHRRARAQPRHRTP